MQQITSMMASEDPNSKLLEEVQNNNIKGIKKALKEGADVNYVDESGNFALLLASNSDFNYEVAKFLIKKGANVNLANSNGETALMKSCEEQYNSSKVLKLLIKSGAHVNAVNKSGESALIIACHYLWFDHMLYKTASTLLKHRAEINMQDNDGWSALMRVCQHFADFSRTINCLLHNGARVNLQNSEGKTALMIACDDDGYNECIPALIDSGADLNLQDNQGRTALMIAYRNFLDQVYVKLLITNGADIDLQDNQGWTALMFAARKGLKELLIKNGPDKDVQDELYAIAIDMNGTYYACVEFLIEKGALLDMQDNEGNTALIIAYKNGDGDLFMLLVNKGADVNLQNKKGRSMLMIACDEQHVKCIEFLVEKGVETNLQDNEGSTALMIASRRGNKNIVEQLISKGKAEVNSQDHQGRTALMHSVHFQEKWCQQADIAEVARSLIESGANIDLLDNLGWSALMISCQNECVEVCSILLDKGANSSLKNIEGLTAFDIAMRSKNRDLFSLFSKLRSDPSFPGILLSGGNRKESITAAGKDIICLEDVGISLSIPKDALPSTDPPLDIQIQPCFSGSFEMPDNIKQVSPAYIVSPSRKVAFQKEVLVKIWHHANLETEEDCEDMVFLSASTSPQYRGDTPVYTFREIRGAKGSFRPGEEQPAGQIALKHFCILSLGKRVHSESDDSPESKHQRNSSG